jgi:hypothetical protein
MPDEGAVHRRVIEYKLECGESRLNVICDIELREKALDRLIQLRGDIESYINRDPFFLTSYSPIEVKSDAPAIVREMAESSSNADVGPMASVAGAIAEDVGRFLLENGARHIVVENGGDIYLSIREAVTVGVHAGPSEWSNRIAFKLKPGDTPVGICTSSATVGHSISLGEADAVTVVADSTALADAAATAIGNRVKGQGGVDGALKFGRSIKDLRGFLVVKGERLAAWGRMPELVEMDFDIKR